MRFEYDPQKSEANQASHQGIDFTEAQAVFFDPDYLRLPAKRVGERRFLAIGEAYGRVLSVVYTERGDAVRIISARVATEKERKAYYGAR